MKAKCPNCKREFEIEEKLSKEAELAEEIVSAIARNDKKGLKMLKKKAAQLYTAKSQEKMRREERIKKYLEYAVRIAGAIALILAFIGMLTAKK